MNYEITFVWTSSRDHLNFDPVAVRFSPLHRYEEIRRQYLREQSIVLPVANPVGWTGTLMLDDVQYMHVKFFSDLDTAALQKQLEQALVPAFVDRLEVKPVRFPTLGVIALN